ncbi:hypothetical protein [Fervidobacterium islandicum]|nr:hypothetical protein [Fervidobacterium islandicum]
MNVDTLAKLKDNRLGNDKSLQSTRWHVVAPASKIREVVKR